MVFRAKENYFGLLLTTAFSDEFVANSYATCREGAKMPRADWNEMGNYPVLIPHGKTLLVFNSITKFVISKQFDLEPIVFTSLFISCIIKSNLFPALSVVAAIVE